MGRRVATAEHLKGVDRDHLLFYRPEWSLNALARTLRNNPMLIPHLDREVHEAKHDAVAFVPLLGRFTLQRVVKDYRAIEGDYVGSLDGLISTIDSTRRVNTLPEDERRYSEATIDALERSRPYVVEGLVIPDRHLHLVASK